MMLQSTKALVWSELEDICRRNAPSLSASRSPEPGLRPPVAPPPPLLGSWLLPGSCRHTDIILHCVMDPKLLVTRYNKGSEKKSHYIRHHTVDWAEIFFLPLLNCLFGHLFNYRFFPYQNTGYHSYFYCVLVIVGFFCIVFLFIKLLYAACVILLQFTETETKRDIWGNMKPFQSTVTTICTMYTKQSLIWQWYQLVTDGSCTIRKFFPSPYPSI